jgi:hypothetical protein
MASSTNKASPEDLRMLKDFGFKDYNYFLQYFNLKPGGFYSKKVSTAYDFRWRYKIIKNNYKNSPIKNELIKFHIRFEDYLLTNRRGYNTSLPIKTTKQYDYLFKNLQRPWIISNKYKYKQFYIIKDPNKNIWFRAIDNRQMIPALDICYKESARFSTRTKPPKTYKLGLNWKECESTYRKVRGSHSKFSLWLPPKDYDVALSICDNITSTWDTRTGNWTPWSYKWCKLAHQKIHLSVLRSPTNFKVIAKYVGLSGWKGIGMGGYIVGVAFAAGGSRAAAIIKKFCKEHNIKPFWEK